MSERYLITKRPAPKVIRLDPEANARVPGVPRVTQAEIDEFQKEKEQEKSDAQIDWEAEYYKAVGSAASAFGSADDVHCDYHKKQFYADYERVNAITNGGNADENQNN